MIWNIRGNLLFEKLSGKQFSVISKDRSTMSESVAEARRMAERAAPYDSQGLQRYDLGACRMSSTTVEVDVDWRRGMRLLAVRYE